MQIVIDIPEDIIEGAKSSPNYYPAYHFEKIWKAIVNGTVLPKGHGDIVDIKHLIDMFWDGKSMEITKYDLSAIEPIIKAVAYEEKEEEEERE